MKFLQKLDNFVNDLFQSEKEQVKPTVTCKEVESCDKQDEWAKFDPNIVYDGDKKTFYVDCGNLTPEEAEALMDRMRKKLQEKKECCEKTDALPDLFKVKGEKELRAIVMFHIDVGQLPPQKAEDLVQRRMLQYKGLFDRLPEDVGLMVLPSRHGTTVEYIVLNAPGSNYCL